MSSEFRDFLRKMYLDIKRRREEIIEELNILEGRLQVIDEVIKFTNSRFNIVLEDCNERKTTEK